MSTEKKVWVTIRYNGGHGQTHHVTEGFLNRLENYLRTDKVGKRMDVVITRNF